MNPGSSAQVAAFNRVAGKALAVTRARLAKARREPMSQLEMAAWAARVLDTVPVTRMQWTNLETGRRMVPAALLLAVVEASGFDLGEVLAEAMHRMGHPDEAVLAAGHQDLATIARAKSTPKPTSGRRPKTRTARLTAALMEADDKLRAAGEAEHPPGDQHKRGREQGDGR